MAGIQLVALGQPTRVTEKFVSMPTYPFSDPNPVAANVNEYPNMYPYFRFDGFTDKVVEKKWKVVELENEYIRVMVFPEIGGKVWTAIEKKSGEPFLYYNHVVKFRDVAMRGAWTSGGIEFNYGIIGHTPNCATPVDYLTRVNADGSASCIIGTLDLVTRTNWRVEINLPADKAYFTTRSSWHNAGPVPVPYYHWSNAAVSSQGDLEFVAPGNKYIGHAGETGDWPLHPGNGKNLSMYEQNNFGEYKSYHVTGKQSHFFGGYAHNKDRGMAHYALKDEKPGKKLFIWGLSQQGMIWEHILSDSDGQYVEVQSGRLFNQNVEASSYTPFKQLSFMPYVTQGWTEYWFPVLRTHGISMANPLGALHVEKGPDKIRVYFSAVSPVNDTLSITLDRQTVYKRYLQLAPLDVFVDSIRVTHLGPVQVSIGENKLVYNEVSEADTLSRPISGVADYRQSAYGLYRIGADRLAQRFYAEAGSLLHSAILKDPYLVPALSSLAELKYYEMKYDSASDYARKALEIDTYDGMANYFFGLASLAGNRIHDAQDAFSIATLTLPYQGAAYTQLAIIALQQAQYPTALEYAEKALDINRKSSSALSVKAVAHRKLLQKETTLKLLDSSMVLDPLDHFAMFEKYLLDSVATPYSTFALRLRNEMPEQTILELAIRYYSFGCNIEAISLLERIPENPEALYWLAWLMKEDNKPFTPLLEKADRLSAHLVFPFRAESARVLEWASATTGSWKSTYYLALIYRSHNNPYAKKLLEQCGDMPDYAPFYITRMQDKKGDSAARLQHILKAASIDPSEWRYQKLLAEYYIEAGQYARALEVTSTYNRKKPADYRMGMLHARTLLFNGAYKQTADLLSTVHILPYEGAIDGHELYREAKLMQAAGLMKQGKFKLALPLILESQTWPVNLGAGKPYDSDIDVQLPRYMMAICYHALGKVSAFQEALHSITTLPPGYKSKPASVLVKAWALDKLQPGIKGTGLYFLDDLIKAKPSDRILAWAIFTYRKMPFLIPAAEKDTDMRVMEVLKDF